MLLFNQLAGPEQLVDRPHPKMSCDSVHSNGDPIVVVQRQKGYSWPQQVNGTVI